MMSEIVFYTNPQSRGRIVHWLLEELAEPYDTQWIDYGEQMKGAEYLAVNLMGKVPAIKHLGAVVTETSAICTYLAASYPEKNLIPAVGDPALADFYRWMFFAAGPVEMATTAKSMAWEVEEGKQRSVGFGSHEDAMDALAERPPVVNHAHKFSRNGGRVEGGGHEGRILAAQPHPGEPAE